MKFHVITLGCPKNRVDTEHILGNLKAGLKEFELVDSQRKSDIILINTCSFIEDAVSESIETILESASKKSEDQQLVVTGCLVERYGAETLKKELPEVDLFLGFEAVRRLPEILGASQEQAELFRLLSTPPWRAYLKISEGCSNKCTYCLIPRIRGQQICRNPVSILKEAEELAASGVKEITLVAQDLTAYHHDGADLADLLEQLADKLEQTWLRLLYLYPSKISDKLLNIIAEHNNICPYFDIPIQHSSSTILKKMGRQYSSKDLYSLLERIKNKIPGAHIRTSVIVGFPGETERDFQELKTFIEEAQFDHLGCFAYSDEEEAPSAKFTDKVDAKKAEKRRSEIMEIQQEISRQKMKQLVGTTQKVLVEGLSDETDLLLVGRTKYQAPEIDGQVFINKGFADPGEIVKVKITDSHIYDLVGKVI